MDHKEERIIAYCHITEKLGDSIEDLKVSVVDGEGNGETYISNLSPLGEACIEVIQGESKSTRFIIGTNTHCQLKSYKIIDKSFFGKAKQPRHKEFTHSMVPIYVHRGILGCQRQRHPLERVIAHVKSLDENIICINVNYCVKCDMYFISEISLRQYERNSGLLLFNRIPHESMTEYYEDVERKAKSLLYLHGYSTSQNVGLEDDERQQILAYVIDTDTMWPQEIISLLESLIAINGKKYTNIEALEKWKDDLYFVLQYKSESQNHVSGKLDLWKNNRQV